MMRVVSELIAGLSALLPPWALAVLAAIAAPFVVMAWTRYVRAKQIRGALRTAFRTTDPVLRAAAVEKAFELAGLRERAVIALADTAHTTGLVDVTTRALALMEAHGWGREDVRRIRAATAKPKKKGGHPVEEVVVIERMIEQEMLAAARIRLEEALARFPSDPDLIGLQEALARQDSTEPRPA